MMMVMSSFGEVERKTEEGIKDWDIIGPILLLFLPTRERLAVIFSCNFHF